MRIIYRRITNFFAVATFVFLIIWFWGSPRAAFISFRLMEICFVIISPALLTIFKSKEWGDGKRIVMSLFTITVFAGIFLAIEISDGNLFDYPYVLKKEYIIVTGKVAMIRDIHPVKGKSYQKIMIGNEEYKNETPKWLNAEVGKIYILKYLLNSKQVMEIVGPLRELPQTE